MTRVYLEGLAVRVARFERSLPSDEPMNARLWIEDMHDVLGRPWTDDERAIFTDAYESARKSNTDLQERPR